MRKTLFLLLLLGFANLSLSQSLSSSEVLACENLRLIHNLTITSAQISDNDQSDQPYCYIRGIISPAIHFHAQLPLPRNWNGRFLNGAMAVKMVILITLIIE